jgi:hypothetical protein
MGLELYHFDSLPELYAVLDELAKRPLFTLELGGPTKKGKK